MTFLPEGNQNPLKYIRRRCSIPSEEIYIDYISQDLEMYFPTIQKLHLYIQISYMEICGTYICQKKA